MKTQYILLLVFVLGPLLAVLLLWRSAGKAEDPPDVMEWMEPPPAHWSSQKWEDS